MWQVFKQRPAVVVNAAVLHDEHLADVPGGHAPFHLHRPATVVLVEHFDHLQHQKHLQVDS